MVSSPSQTLEKHAGGNEEDHYTDARVNAGGWMVERAAFNLSAFASRWENAIQATSWAFPTMASSVNTMLAHTGRENPSSVHSRTASSPVLITREVAHKV